MFTEPRTGKLREHVPKQRAQCTVKAMDIEKEIQNLPLKEMDGTLLSFAILAGTPAEHYATVKDAIQLSAFLHRGATRASRGVMPRDHYVTHPLRNTLRLMRWGVTDVRLLVASLLHDTVEDCVNEILDLSRTTCLPVDDDKCAHEESKITAALNVMAERFDGRVAAVLRGVTNPVFESSLTRAQKEQAYRDHVVGAVSEDEGVLLVKVADFIDNAGSLHHNVSDKPDMVKRLAGKYLPLVSELRDVSVKMVTVPQTIIDDIVVQLDRISERLIELEEM